MFGIKQAATIELPTNLLVPSFLDRNISNPKELMVLLEEAGGPTYSLHAMVIGVQNMDAA